MCMCTVFTVKLTFHINKSMAWHPNCTFHFKMESEVGCYGGMCLDVPCPTIPRSHLPPTHGPHWQRPLPSAPDVNCGLSPRPECARQQLHGSSSVPLNELPPKICRHQPQTLPWDSIHPDPHGTPGSTEQSLLWLGSVQTLNVPRMRPL